MDKSQMDAFRSQTQNAFQQARPGVFRYDGGEPLAGSIVFGTVQVEMDPAPMNLRGVTITVSKTVLADAPVVGKRVTVGAESFEVYEVGGQDSTRWLFRAATFPGKRK